jgi:hypothetical protein
MLLLWLLSCDNDVSITRQKIDLDEDGYVAEIDCDDSRKTVHPDAPELCDGLDNDCDEEIDEDAEEAEDWYLDSDGDGFGDSSQTVSACEQPEGYVADDGDCDDGEALVYPGAIEVCDGLDNDCDGLSDDDDPSATGKSTEYLDSDGDGFGAQIVTACDLPWNTVTNMDDCDDSDSSIHPLATEVCSDGIDNDCDGVDDSCNGCGSGNQTTISTLNYNGMTYYMLALEPCLPYYSGNCCSGTTDQEEADAFCQLAGYCEAVSYVVQAISSTNCYCWGACTNYSWYSNCCSGTDTRYFITEVTCQ